jgi:hypothetical protein
MSAASYSAEMVKIATSLWGAQNDALSTRKEARFGSNGSKSIDLAKAVFFDHEANTGGGYRDLYKLANGEFPENGNGFDRTAEFRPPAGMLRELGAPIDKWDYHDQNGATVIRVVRFEPPGADKTFRQCRPVDSGWKWTTKGIQVPPYRLPVLLKAEPGSTVYITEGEKHADALIALGLVATTNAGGAKKFQAHHAEALVGFKCIILPDNDKTGEVHAAGVMQELKTAGCKDTSILRLPSLPPKGDVIDWIESGGTRAELEALAAAPYPQTERKGDDNVILALIERFNAKFKVVNENGKAVIYQPWQDPVLKRRCFNRLSPRDLITLYMNEHVQTGTDALDYPIYKCVADVWLRHKHRRQYIDGMVFDPSMQAPADVLNLWEGFALKPKPGDWSLMRDHIRTVICDGDHIRFDYLIRWIARMFQHPAEQGEVAVVLKGDEGAGKGTLAKVIIRLLGQHGFAVSNPKHLVGNFNSHLRDAVFLFADEAFFAGDRQHIGVLKSLITEPYLTIEAKYANAIQCPNFLHIMMASNEEWVVPASLESRRFFVLVVPNTKLRDRPYFNAIWEQMESGGYAAMLHDLLAMDLTGFDVRDVPTTAGLHEQRKLSLPVPERWWLDVLHRGYVFKSKLGLEAVLGDWMPNVATELLFASYTDYAEKARDRRPMSRVTFGGFMVSLNAISGRFADLPTGEKIADVENPHGGTNRKAAVVRHPSRPKGYSLGSLSAARADFCRATGLVIDWGDSDE